MSMTEEEYRALLAEDPGNAEFANYALLLREDGRIDQAILVCLAGLSANPSCHRGRLLLAQSFYDREFFPFAVRELQALTVDLPNNAAVKRLLETLSPETLRAVETERAFAPSAAEPSTVAETDFDFDELAMLEDD